MKLNTILDQIDMGSVALPKFQHYVEKGEWYPHPRSLPHKRRRDFNGASLPFPHFGPGMGEMSSIFTTPGKGNPCLAGKM